MITRCTWVNLENPLYITYHDNEWGRPVYDDKILFEFLVLEGAQAGLSWETVLNKRENYRSAFDEFDVQKISEYWEEKIQELLNNKWIIRNKLKINSAIRNAKVFLEIQKEFWSFSQYLWKYVWKKQIVNNPQNLWEVPAQTTLSQKISKNLKKRGMNFIWPTIIYAYMQAVWIVSDHTSDCYLKIKWDKWD